MVHPEIQTPLEWDIHHPGYLVIENPEFYLKLLCELSFQNIGQDGGFICSEKNQEVSLNKDTVLIRDPISLDLNQRKILNAVLRQIERIAQEEFFSETQEVKMYIRQYAEKLTQSTMIPLECSDTVEFVDIVKAAGLRIENAEHPIERMLDFIATAQEFLHIKLIILAGVRQIFTDEQYRQFCKEIELKKLYLLFLEPIARERIAEENMLIVDCDRCEMLFT